QKISATQSPSLLLQILNTSPVRPYRSPVGSPWCSFHGTVVFSVLSVYSRVTSEKLLGRENPCPRSLNEKADRGSGSRALKPALRNSIYLVAAAKRSATSSQLNTFHTALT